MNRVLLFASELDRAGRAVLRDRRAAHLLRTLAVAPGSRVRIGVINGARGWGEVSAVSPDSVILDCRFEEREEAAGAAPVDLILALPRPKAMKRLWAPLAMLGVGRVDIVNAEKVERNYFDTHWLDPTYYEPLLIEGLEQAGDTRMPAVAIHRRFRPFVEDQVPALYGGHVRWVGHPGAEMRAPAWEGAAERAVLAVGPEGGWADFELGLLQAAGFRPVSLGSRTLRTDVACISLLTLAAAGKNA
jgi:16S rRNA (uracil1498-N3)-methyltransferase